MNQKADFDYLQFKQDHCFPTENTASGIFSRLQWNYLLQLSHSTIRSPVSSVLQSASRAYLQHTQLQFNDWRVGRLTLDHTLFTGNSTTKVLLKYLIKWTLSNAGHHNWQLMVLHQMPKWWQTQLGITHSQLRSFVPLHILLANSCMAGLIMVRIKTQLVLQCLVQFLVYINC